MRNKLWPLPIITLILFFSVFVASCKNRESNNYLIDKIRVESRAESERIIAEHSWERLDTDILDNINNELYNAVHLRGWHNSLYVMDYSDLKIKKFDKKGNLLNEIGNGNGRGPGEFLTFSDMDYHDGKIWVSDVNKREVLIFDTTGIFLNSFSFNESNYRISILDSTINLLAMGDSLLIHQYEVDGYKLRSFGRVIEDQFRNTMALSGRIITSKFNDEIIYAPLKASYLFYFDKKGNMLRSVETIDKIKFPVAEPEVLSDGSLRASAPSMMAELTDILIENDTLMIKSFLYTDKDRDNRIDYIDFYSADGESYYYSVEVPFISHSFTKIGNVYLFIEIGSQEIKGITLNFN